MRSLYLGPPAGGNTRSPRLAIGRPQTSGYKTSTTISVHKTLSISVHKSLWRQRVKHILVVGVSLLSLCACRMDPSAIDDYSGLGNSLLAKHLRFSLFLGENAVNDSIGQFVNKPNGTVEGDSTNKLLSLGFNCKPLSETICSYDGSARSAITSTDGSNILKFTTFVHIDVILDMTPMKVVSKISRQPY